MPTTTATWSESAHSSVAKPSQRRDPNRRLATEYCRDCSRASAQSKLEENNVPRSNCCQLGSARVSRAGRQGSREGFHRYPRQTLG
ncbi:hypothetical protein T01_6537 [Trichinella spiralis]|uniref:Uncharacterized protein n=1 Tax=Trichinella spiralis TaxID=6334 RepID=A0A0V1C0J3_TRISP|nr:hypothetical protein T01_6537 [Trichinella spiralis]